MRPWQVFLDVDNTLYDFPATFGRALGIVRERHFPDIDHERFVGAYEACANGVDGGWALLKRDPMAFRRRVVADVLQTLGTSGEAEAIVATLDRARRETLKPRPGLHEGLDKLRAAASLGVITNGPSALQREKLRILRMEDYMRPSQVHVSGELPWDKPDLRIFRLAQARAGVPAHRCIMVGDNPETDGGAAACGWHVVLTTPATPWEAAVAEIGEVTRRR